MQGNNVAFSKRGIAYNNPSLANVFSSHCPSCGWTYNWQSTSEGVDRRLQYFPLLWSADDRFVRHWYADASAAIADGSVALFSFNEPDNPGQANMSHNNAASKHIQHMNKFAGQALIGSPAVTNSAHDTEGLGWLHSFLVACGTHQDGPCAIDFCNVHWYSALPNITSLFDHLAQAHDLCGGIPIWLTELGLTGSEDQVSQFIAAVVPRLEALSYLHAYSYFMVREGILMNSSSLLSQNGKAYATPHF